MPADNPACDAVSVSVAGAVVVLKVAVSQPAPLVYDVDCDKPFNVPPPPFVTTMVCDAGAAPPTPALNVAVVLERAMVVGTGTDRVTGISNGEFPATGDETAMLAVYVPGESPVALVCTVIVAGAEFRFSDALSHPEPETYCTAVVSPLNVPPPLLVMPTVCVALPVNVSAVGATTIVGGVVTVKVTGTSRGVLVAPGAAMRTLAV